MAKKPKRSKRPKGPKKDSAKLVAKKVHDIYLAGLGAATTVGEGGAKLAQGAIEKGKRLAKTGKKKGKKRVEDVEAGFEALSGWVDGRIQKALERVGVPTRAEVRALTERLDLLLEKVSHLETPTSAARRSTERSPAKRTRATKRAATRGAATRGAAPGTAPAAAKSERATAASVYHVSPHGEGWQILLEGADPPLAVERTKKLAMNKARAAAKSALPSRIVVHRADGAVQTSYDYD